MGGKWMLTGVGFSREIEMFWNWMVVIVTQHYKYTKNFRVDALKIDWFDLLAIQRTFRSLLQHHSLKASFLRISAFFMVQLSQLNMAIGKTITLTFVGRVMTFLSTPCLGWSELSCQEADVFWFHGCSHHPSDFRAQEEEICHYFHLFPLYLPLGNASWETYMQVRKQQLELDMQQKTGSK